MRVSFSTIFNNYLRMKKIFIFIGVLYFITSCLESEDSGDYEGYYSNFKNANEATELTIFNKYLESHPELNANTLDSIYEGLYVQTIKEGIGKKVVSTDSILYCIKGTFLRSDTVWHTDYIETTGYEPLPKPQKVYSTNNVFAVKRALLKMKVGGKSRVTSLSRYAFGYGSNIFGIPQYCSNIWDIEVLGASSDTSIHITKVYEKEVETRVKLKLKEKGGIVKYIETDPTNKKDTMTYFIYNEGNTSKKPITGDIVEVSYKGFYENGALFDSDTVNYKYFRIDKGGFINGFNLSVAQIGEGGHLVCIIPPRLAYSNASSDIPNFTPIMFDIKLVRVERDNIKSIVLTKNSMLLKK